MDSNTDDSKNHKISNDENNNNNTYDDKIDEDLVDLEDRNVQGPIWRTESLEEDKIMKEHCSKR